jgi:hypothetical protein
MSASISQSFYTPIEMPAEAAGITHHFTIGGNDG